MSDLRTTAQHADAFSPCLATRDLAKRPGSSSSTNVGATSVRRTWSKPRALVNKGLQPQEKRFLVPVGWMAKAAANLNGSSRRENLS